MSSCLLPELGFLTPSITVPESAGLAQVCVELVGEQALAEPVTATVANIGGTATGLELPLECSLLNQCLWSGRAFRLDCRVSWVRVASEAAHFL